MIILLNSILLIISFFDKSLQLQVRKLNLYEGEICQYGEGPDTNYECKRLENCDTLRDDIKKKIYPDICSFDRNKPIFCCSPSIVFNRLENSNIANEKCRQYSELGKSKWMNRNTIVKNTTDDNSNVNEIIELSIAEMTADVYPLVGGIPAAPMEFPHMALIGFGETTDQIQWGCGGSLIGERWILTAAHCKQLGLIGVARWARLGDLNIVSNADVARPKDYRIAEHVLHPDYKPPSLYNDIALFRLETDVEFSQYVRPICLNSSPSLSPEVLTATGWGKISTGEPTSNDLLKVDLIVIPANQCNASYFVEDNPKLEFGILPDAMICAGSTQGDKDTCGGDSGGPLQIRNANYNGMYTQVGITSFGKFCGDKNAPGVYTRVSKYIQWIQSIVWP